MLLLNKIKKLFESKLITGEDLTPDEPVYINQPFEYQYFPKPKNCSPDSNESYEHAICLPNTHPFFIHRSNFSRDLNYIIRQWAEKNNLQYKIREPKILRFESNLNEYNTMYNNHNNLLERNIAFKFKSEADLFVETWKDFGKDYFYFENKYNGIHEYVFLIKRDNWNFFDRDILLAQNNPNYGSYCINNGILLIGDYEKHLMPRSEIKRKLDNIIGLSNYVIEDATDLETYGMFEGRKVIYGKILKFYNKQHAMSFKLLI